MPTVANGGQLHRDVTEAIHRVGLEVTIEGSDDAIIGEPSTHTIVVLGRPISAAAFGAVARAVAALGVNIDFIRGVSDYPVTGLELRVSVPPGSIANCRPASPSWPPSRASTSPSRSTAWSENKYHRLRLTKTPDQVRIGRRSPSRAGALDAVATITEAATRRGTGLAESLHRRVATLVGLPAEVIDESEEIELTPARGRRSARCAAWATGCGVVSGGFRQVIEPLAHELMLDPRGRQRTRDRRRQAHRAVVGPVIDRAGKAKAL